ncbi:MAG: fimbria/pilus outer membrane usher protein [Pseudomonadota bacterium]
MNLRLWCRVSASSLAVTGFGLVLADGLPVRDERNGASLGNWYEFGQTYGEAAAVDKKSVPSLEARYVQLISADRSQRPVSSNSDLVGHPVPLEPEVPLWATVQPPARFARTSVDGLSLPGGLTLVAADAISPPDPPDPPEPAAGPAAPSLAETGSVYTPTSRRDPLETPLLETDIWQEWLLAVVLNGEPVSDATMFVENPDDGSFAIEADALENWRIRYDIADVLTFQGNPYLPLAKLEGAEHEIDRSALSLRLQVPADLFDRSSYDLATDTDVEPQSGVGGFFDYDLLFTDGTDIDDNLGGLFEFGGFGSLGHGITNFRVEAMSDDPDATRLESFLRHDFMDRRATLRLGDSLTEGGSFASGKRFGGVQFGTNFATDPSFVTFPRPSIGGLAEQNSVVDVVIDNATRATRNVPPGPFSIDNLPVVTGAGEVQLKVTDLLGREQIVTQPYYVSSRLLREGLHEYSYGLGFERQDFGTESFEYGQPLANATHRYGFTNRITSEAHIESEIDRHSAVLGASALAGSLGVVSGGLGGSYDEGDVGALGQIAYEYLAGSWNLSLRTRYTSSEFRQFGDDGTVRRIDQANLGLDFNDWGRVGLLLINRDLIDEENDQLVTGTYSVPLGPGNLLFNAVQTIEPDNELALTATYSIPLGPKRSISTSVERRDGDYGVRSQYRRTRGSSDIGLDYRLSAEAQEDETRLDGRISYQSQYGSGDLEVERQDGDYNLRTGLSGSLALVDGHVSASRRIGQAFGIVSMPGFADVRVLIDNREAGRTDENGQLMLPRLRAFERNRVSFKVEDLPLDARVGFNEVMAVPMDRSGVLVDFGIARSYQATALFLDGDGAVLPAGLQLIDETGDVEAWVARDGYTQILGLRTGEALLTGTQGEVEFQCAIFIPEDAESFADLGTIQCLR